MNMSNIKGLFKKKKKKNLSKNLDLYTDELVWFL